MILKFLWIVVLITLAKGLKDENNNLLALHSDENSVDHSKYVVCIDAGSSGSRIHLYTWERKSDDTLISLKPVMSENTPVVKKIRPGLSTFANNSSAAADYIAPLLNFVEAHVPTEKQQDTPFYLFATAGMRLLTEEQQTLILTNLKTQLQNKTTLQIDAKNIRIIEGRWEGVYNWISLNYILGKFNKQNESRSQTVGMTEMGGASVQIAYELLPNNTFKSEDVVILNLAFSSSDPYFNYTIYAASFLGYGANEAYKTYIEDVDNTVRESRLKIIDDNCLPKNYKELVKIENNKSYLRSGTGNWDGCLTEAEFVLKHFESQLTCKRFHPICSLGNPSPNVSLSDMDLMGLSEFWYSTHVILGLGGAYDAASVAQKSREYCGTDYKDIKASQQANKWPGVDDERLHNQCFKAAWVTAVLHDGFSIDKNKNHFQTALKIEQEDIQWTLGAMIYELRNQNYKN